MSAKNNYSTNKWKTCVCGYLFLYTRFSFIGFWYGWHDIIWYKIRLPYIHTHVKQSMIDQFWKPMVDSRTIDVDLRELIKNHQSQSTGSVWFQLILSMPISKMNTPTEKSFVV